MFYNKGIVPFGDKGGVNKVNIKIDASRVSGIITGSANLDKIVFDTWYLKDVELMERFVIFIQRI